MLNKEMLLCTNKSVDVVTFQLKVARWDEKENWGYGSGYNYLGPFESAQLAGEVTPNSYKGSEFNVFGTYQWSSPNGSTTSEWDIYVSYWPLEDLGKCGYAKRMDTGAVTHIQVYESYDNSYATLHSECRHNQPWKCFISKNDIGKTITIEIGLS